MCSLHIEGSAAADSSLCRRRGLLTAYPPDRQPHETSRRLRRLSRSGGQLSTVRRSMNPGLDIEGVLLTMFDGRTNLSIQVAQELKRFFAGKVYSTVIPRNVRLSEAPSHGKPITAYDKTCRGADAYTALAAEFLRKNNC